MKISVFLCLGLVSFSSMSFAKSQFPMSPKIDRQLAKVKPQHKHITPVSCPDFSGKWVGVCSNKSDANDFWASDMNIMQVGCQQLIYDNISTSLGSLVSLSNAELDNGEFRMMNFSMSFVWFGDVLEQMWTFNTNQAVAGVAKQQMWLEGDTLKTDEIDSAVVMPSAWGPTVHIQSQCTYNKQ